MQDRSRNVPLADMAERYGKSSKTFKRYVVKLGIPHEEIGPTWYFDPQEVSSHLRTTRTEDVSRVKVVPINKKKGPKVVSRKFAEA